MMVTLFTMNPNEINIEYLNKENGAVPLEIQNPDYFYLGMHNV